MKYASLALALAVVALVALPAPLAGQETKMARGTASVIAVDALTVKSPAGEMKFVVDSKTKVEAIGAGTRARQAEAAGQAGPKLTEVLKVGQPVTVSYTESGGVLHAVNIRAISNLGSAGAAQPAARPRTSNGRVQSISATSMTITGSAGAGSRFTQTFTIDGNTKVIGPGAGTAAAAAGGKTAATDVIANGDTVSVTFLESGKTLSATEIRVTAKAAK
jgi:hypothetical protein